MAVAVESSTTDLLTTDSSTAAATTRSCENCDTLLQGHYCHQCGQSLINPIRHAGHALEEVFESFWHLDGRVFRTLRDLLAPGRAAINYIAGHRARYIAPLRLFVILTVLTFFVGKLTVHSDGVAIGYDGREDEIVRAQTVAEVEQIRDRLLKELRVAETESAEATWVNPVLIAARTRIQGEAASRIAELKGEALSTDPAPAAPATTPRDTITPGTKPSAASGDNWDILTFNGRPWHPETNPLTAAWLPDFANRWLNRRVGRAQDNLARMQSDPDLWLKAFMGALPTALFVLMPVFALLLKGFYIGTRRLYLEHLVVALYSHAFLLLTLLALFLINALQPLLVPWANTLLGVGEFALYAWMPIYLLLMQKRVYGQTWWLTWLKYLVLGTVYFVLVTFAAVFAFLAGMTS